MSVCTAYDGDHAAIRTDDDGDAGHSVGDRRPGRSRPLDVASTDVMCDAPAGLANLAAPGAGEFDMLGCDAALRGAHRGVVTWL